MIAADPTELATYFVQSGHHLPLIANPVELSQLNDFVGIRRNKSICRISYDGDFLPFGVCHNSRVVLNVFWLDHFYAIGTKDMKTFLIFNLPILDANHSPHQLDCRGAGTLGDVRYAEFVLWNSHAPCPAVMSTL